MISATVFKWEWSISSSSPGLLHFLFPANWGGGPGLEEASSCPATPPTPTAPPSLPHSGTPSELTFNLGSQLAGSLRFTVPPPTGVLSWLPDTSL